MAPPHQRSTSRSYSSPNKPGQGSGKAHGFRVGPAHAPKDAYLGKAQKLKSDLILRAKLKKSYAQTLKREGLQSNRLPSRPSKGGKTRATGANDVELNEGSKLRIFGKKPSATAVGTGAGKGSDEDDDDEDDVGMDSDEREAARQATLERRKLKGKSRAEDESFSLDGPGRAPASGKAVGAGKGPKGKGPMQAAWGAMAPGSKPGNRRERAGMSRSQTHGALSAADAKGGEKDTEAQTSLRDLKREAYAKQHRGSATSHPHPRPSSSSSTKPSGRPSTSSGAGAASSNASGSGGKGGFLKRSNSFGSSLARHVTGGGELKKSKSRGGGGQPDLGARMGVLLEQIKRSKA